MASGWEACIRDRSCHVIRIMWEEKEKQLSEDGSVEGERAGLSMRMED